MPDTQPPIPLPPPPRRYLITTLDGRRHGPFVSEGDAYAYTSEHGIQKWHKTDLLCTYCGVTVIGADGVRVHGAECPERTHS